MIKHIFKNQRFIIAYLLLASFFVMSACKSNTGHIDHVVGRDIQHEIVYYEEDRFAGWPANQGIWSWENEILVGFVEASHEEKTGHTYDRSSARDKYARSRDGGLKWVIEDAYEKGQTTLSTGSMN